MDIKATDTAGKRYNIEIQRDDSVAIPKRARYHAAMMDYTGLKKREKFEKSKETYIIFLTEVGYFKKSQEGVTNKRRKPAL